VEQDKWAGEVDWSEVIIPVNAGNRTFKWEYYKDTYVTNGFDCAWIDNISFPSTVLSKPSSITISISGSIVTLGWNAVDGATSYEIWSSDNPYSGFTYETNVTGVTNWSAPLSGDKKFYYVKAIN